MTYFVIVGEKDGQVHLFVERDAPPGSRSQDLSLTEEYETILSGCWEQVGCKGYLSKMAQSVWDQVINGQISAKFAPEETAFRHRNAPKILPVIVLCVSAARILALKQREAQHV